MQFSNYETYFDHRCVICLKGTGFGIIVSSCYPFCVDLLRNLRHSIVSSFVSYRVYNGNDILWFHGKENRLYNGNDTDVMISWKGVSILLIITFISRL